MGPADTMTPAQIRKAAKKAAKRRKMNSLVLNQLFRRYANQQAAIDQEENASLNQYQQGIGSLLQNRRADLERLRNSFASKGRTHSGANLKANVDTRKSYDAQQARMDAAKNLAAAEANRKRAAADRDFESEKTFN
jgi:hypothetical protein